MSALLDSLKADFVKQVSVYQDDTKQRDMRQKALASALQTGLPTLRQERWKYTNLRALAARALVTSVDDEIIVDSALIASIPAPRLVIVNGRYDSALSLMDALPDGAHLYQRSDQSIAAVQTNHAQDVFQDLNLALSREGVVLTIDANTRIEAPIHIVHIGAAASSDLAIHLRHQIHIGENAKLALVEHVIAANAHSHLINTVAEITVAANATLTHVRIQNESPSANSIAHTNASLAANAFYQRLDLELGAGLSRHELNVELLGEQARLIANGVLLANGRRHLDTRLGIDHSACNTTCTLNWRGLASERSRAVFHGGILIREGADGTNAELSNKNLLLSDNAEIDTQPVLEIHADEVQAAHGATVGRLDENALFYLRSRGITENHARQLLTAAFARETLSVIEDQALFAVLETQLDAALMKIHG